MKTILRVNQNDELIATDILDINPHELLIITQGLRRLSQIESVHPISRKEADRLYDLIVEKHEVEVIDESNNQH